MINGPVTLTTPIVLVSPPTRWTSVFKGLRYMSAVNISGIESWTMTSSTSITLQTGGIWAPWVEVRFQSTDEVAKTWSSILAGYSTDLKGQATQRASQSTPAAMIAAIVLGGLIVLGIICGAVLVCLRRRHKHSKASSRSLNEQRNSKDPDETKIAEANALREARELQEQRAILKVNTNREAGELQSAYPLELPALMVIAADSSNSARAFE